MKNTNTYSPKLLPILWCAVVLCFSKQISAQLFRPIEQDPFGVTVQFDADSIRKYKIFSISTKIQNKQDGEVIVDKGLRIFNLIRWEDCSCTGAIGFRDKRIR
jgi:hypothetical protein